MTIVYDSPQKVWSSRLVMENHTMSTSSKNPCQVSRRPTSLLWKHQHHLPPHPLPWQSCCKEIVHIRSLRGRVSTESFDRLTSKARGTLEAWKWRVFTRAPIIFSLSNKSFCISCFWCLERLRNAMGCCSPIYSKCGKKAPSDPCHYNRLMSRSNTHSLRHSTS
jgi:hypothetical protein